MRKPRVTVWYSAKSTWCVGVEGPLWLQPGERRTIVLAWYSTRDSANSYASGLRQAMRDNLVAQLQAAQSDNANLRERLDSAEAALRQEAGMENYQPDSGAADHFARYPEAP